MLLLQQLGTSKAQHTDEDPAYPQMRFNPHLQELIPMEHLEVEFGGDFLYEFNQDSYWEQVCRCVCPHGVVWLAMDASELTTLECDTITQTFGCAVGRVSVYPRVEEDLVSVVLLTHAYIPTHKKR